MTKQFMTLGVGLLLLLVGAVLSPGALLVAFGSGAAYCAIFVLDDGAKS